jgi:hypothetical protein
MLLAVFASLTLGTASANARTKPKLKLTARPAVVAPAAMLTVSGRIKGRVPGARRALKVVLEERRGRRWRSRAAVRPTRRLTFVTRWRVPQATGRRTMRLRLLKRRRVLAVSARWHVRVRRPATGGPPIPPPGPPAPGGPSQRQTQVLAPGAIEAAPAPGASGVLRVSGHVAVKSGDVLASGIGAAAPYGFLLKVLGVGYEGGDTVIAVTPATLLEAVPAGEIHETLRLGSTAMRSSANRRRFSKVVKCTAGGEVSIEGFAGLGSPQIDIDADWGGWLPPRVNSVEVTGSLTASAEASAAVTGSASCDVGPIKILETRLPPVAFSVFGIPVVVAPEFGVELSGVGSVEASVGTSVSASLTARAGARYANGRLTPIADLDEDFDFQPPQPQAAAHVEATLASELDVKFYGVGGPELGFNAGLELNANPWAVPWWALEAPISVTAGLEIELLDLEIEPITVYEKTFPLAEGGVFSNPVYPEYRGWFAYETSHSADDFGSQVFAVESGWWADIDRASGDVVLHESIYRRTTAECYLRESAVIVDGEGIVSALPAEFSGPDGSTGPGVLFDLGTSSLSPATSASQDNCESPEISTGMGGSALDEYLTTAPAEYQNPPETISALVHYPNPTGSVRWQFCLSRSTTDTDGDGLPDEVDLAPGQAAPPAQLGIPGGPPEREPIATVLVGPAERGIPSCPAGG